MVFGVSEDGAGFDGDGFAGGVLEVGDDDGVAVAFLLSLESRADDEALDLVAFEGEDGGVFEGEVLLDVIQGFVRAGREEENGEQEGEVAEGGFHGENVKGEG